MTTGSREPLELTVPLGDFSIDALSAAAGGVCSLESVVRQSLYYYLADREAGRPGWPYPRFLRGYDRPGVGDVMVSLRVDDGAWRRFSAEAEAQRVSAEQLLRHAVLYFAADVEAGRVARRMLDELR
jgi:hypothetical protein